MRSRIGSLRDHFIICGFGRVGQETARELKIQLARFVVVDSGEDALVHARRLGYLICEGDATLDETLLDAGVARARCLVAASDSDAGNTYITLVAKALNPGLFVVARVGMPENAQKLLHAGADRVVSPYQLAGQHIAQSAVRMLSGSEVRDPREEHRGTIVGEVMVAEGSVLAGVSLAAMFRDCATVTVLAVRHASGEVTVSPPPDLRVEADDEVVILGSTSELDSVNLLARELSTGSGRTLV